MTVASQRHRDVSPTKPSSKRFLSHESSVHKAKLSRARQPGLFVKPLVFLQGHLIDQFIKFLARVNPEFAIERTTMGLDGIDREAFDLRYTFGAVPLIKMSGDIDLAWSERELDGQSLECAIQKRRAPSKTPSASAWAQRRTIPFLKIVEFALKRDTANRKRHHHYQCN